MADERYRLFACVLYPESLPDDFLDRIDNLHVKAFLSPLHDKDISPDTGKLKKPHYHLFLMFDGKKSIPAVQRLLIDAIDSNWNPWLEVIQSCYSYSRYLCHLDNGNVPWKRIYPIDEVKEFGGADYLATIASNKDFLSIQEQMMEFVDIHRLYYWFEFVDRVKGFRPEWVPYLNKAPGSFVKEYLRSKLQYSKDRKFDYLP